jgi:DNA-directed RNA polymerase subunit RPC12/RpoP
MGIRFYCPNGHKLNVKAFQAGRRGVCPYCGTKFLIPSQSTRKSSKEERAARRVFAAASFPAINPALQNPASGNTGNMPAAETQTSTQKSSSSPPIIDASKTGDDISPQPTNYSSQQTGGGTGFASPVLPTPAVSIADSLTTFSLDDPTIALTETHPADPFTEAGDVVWYVRPPSSGQYGPATGKLMRQWLAEGRIGPDTLVWREGWRDWQQASAVFPQLRTNAPLTDINKNVVPLVQPISLPEAQPADTRTPKNMLSLIVTLIVLTVVIIVGLFIWAYTRGPNPAKVNSRTPSTRLELRDTLNPHRLS